MDCYACPECGYVYDEEKGEPHEGYPAGTLWASLPEEFFCPGCAVRSKADFVALARRESERTFGLAQSGEAL